MGISLTREIAAGGNLMSRRTFLLTFWAAAALAMLSSGALTTPISGQAQDPSLVAYWPLDGDAADASGNGNTGTMVGPVAVPGIAGGALQFDGLDDEVQIQSQAGLNLAPSGPHSYAAWVYLDFVSLPSQPKFILDGVHPPAGGYLGDQRGLRLEDGALPVFKWVTTTSSFRAKGPLPLTVGQWHHLVGTFDGQDGRLYVDGALASVVQSAGTPTVTSIWKIGNISGGGTGTGQFPGLIDDVRVYNRALAANEVAALFEPDEMPPTWACDDPPTGWSATNVVVSCSANDSGSGLANPGDATFQLETTVGLGTETASATTNIREVCDVAGNCATASVGGIQIDRKAPSVVITNPSGQTVTLGQVFHADFSCTEPMGSGVASCAGTVPDGQPLNTAAVGSHSFTVTAADVVGNTTTADAEYVVAFGVCPGFDQSKAHKSGSTIPIRIQLCDAAGANVSSPNVRIEATGLFRVSSMAAAAVEDAGHANPDYGFRFAGGQYMFNLSLKGLAAGTYSLAFAATGDPVSHAVQFQVR